MLCIALSTKRRCVDVRVFTCVPRYGLIAALYYTLASRHRRRGNLHFRSPEASGTKGQSVGELQRESRRVLLVEDEPFVAMVAQQLLEDDGFEVVHVATGGQALSQAQDGVDAAIVDLGLPDMRGEDVVARLRLIRRDLPVVIASGYGLAELSATFKGHDRIGFVSKPYDGQALTRALGDAGF